MKILCIGHSSWDITVPIEEFPVENTKYRFNEKYSAGGGPASNAAFLLGKWGMDTVIASTIGSDDFGTNIKKEFQAVGVNTDYLETNYDKSTSLSFILINKNNGYRTVFNVATEHPALKKLSYDFTPDIILTDGHDYGASQNAISQYQQALTVVDAGRVTPELLELCKYMKYIVSSKGFAETVTGLKFDFENPQSLVSVYSKLQDKYPNSNIVITLEEHGALYQMDNQIKIMPGLKVNAADTTGAGDIFHGAFVYGLANGFDMDKIITYANIAAGLSVGKIGSRLSIPSLSEVVDYYNSKFAVNQVPNTNEQQMASQEQFVNQAPEAQNYQNQGQNQIGQQ